MGLSFMGVPDIYNCSRRTVLDINVSVVHDHLVADNVMIHSEVNHALRISKASMGGIKILEHQNMSAQADSHHQRASHVLCG